MNDIAGKVGVPSSKVVPYLNTLIARELVRKEMPFGSSGGRRNVQHVSTLNPASLLH